jgi:hypothetical protein
MFKGVFPRVRICYSVRPVPRVGPAGMSQTVEGYATMWGVSVPEAQLWCNAVGASYFVRGFWMYAPGGAFTVLAVSTGASNRAAATAWRLNADGMPVTVPEWFLFDVYLYDNLAVGNVSYYFYACVETMSITLIYTYIYIYLFVYVHTNT